MIGDSVSFGWIRETLGSPIGQKQFVVGGLPYTSYIVRWFDSWTGDELETGIGLSIEGELTLSTLENSENADYAFILNPLTGGGEPASLALISNSSNLLIDGISNTIITCLVRDNEGLISTESQSTIKFSLNGEGLIKGDSIVVADNGFAIIEYVSGTNISTAEIIASSDGLISDTIYIHLQDHILLDNFDKYTSNDILESVWQSQAGTNAQVSLVSSGDKLLKFNYAIGNGSPPYAGIQREIDADFSATSILRFSIIPDGSNRDMVIILRAGTDYWRYDYELANASETLVEIPLTEFVPQTANTELNLSALTQISLSILAGNGAVGEGEIYLDDFAFAIRKITGAELIVNENFPSDFKLFQNYPNPFNPVTNIDYQIPVQSSVKIVIVNTLGQVVSTLVDEVKTTGKYNLKFNGSGLSSGVYFVHFTAGKYFTTNKMIMLK